MMLAKRANFTGDLVFSGDDLPRGVTLQADTLPAKVDLEPLVFEAAADAPIGGKMLDFYASSADPSKKCEAPSGNAPITLMRLARLFTTPPRSANSTWL